MTDEEKNLLEYFHSLKKWFAKCTVESRRELFCLACEAPALPLSGFCVQGSLLLLWTLRFFGSLYS